MAKMVKPPKGPKKRTDMKENIGKVLINLGQLIFGTIFLGSVLRGLTQYYIMMSIGLISAIMLITIGLLLTVKEKTDKEE